MTLAVALAAATVIAGTIDMVSQFLPATRTDHLVFVASTDPRPERSQAGVSGGLARVGVSIPDLVDWSEATSAFRAFAGFTFQSAILSGVDIPSRITTVRVTPNLFDVWGITPSVGRTFLPEEAQAGRDQVVIVSEPFWRQQMSAAPDAVRRVLDIDGRAHAVIGVLPANVSRGIFRSADVFVPIVLDREGARRDERRLFVTGVLKPGVNLENAQADLTHVAERLQADYPVTNANTGVVVRPFMEMLGGNITAVIVLLSIIGALVVGIACANVSSVILAQTTTRRRELAVRAALGASRLLQMKPILIENLLISIMAGAFGVLLAWWGMIAIRVAGADLDGFSGMGLSGRVIAVSVGLTLLAPLAFALLPALRFSNPDMDELRQGNRGEETAKGRRLREWLVAGQVALALVLVTQVGLVGRATWRLHNLSTGFDPAQVLTFRMNLRESDYPDKEIRHSFYMRALERIAALPGVSAAGTTSQLPFADREMTIRFVIQGQPAPEPGFHPEAARSTVSYSYLATLGIPLVRGRTLSRADVDDAAPVALISQEAARRYWPGDDPIGKRFAFEDEGDTWLEIVGVVGNVRSASGFGPVPQVYVPASRGLSNAIAFLVRTAGANPTSIAASVRSEMAALDRMQPVYDVRAMRRVISQNLGGTYLFTGMLAVFAVIALLLAAAGAYGLVSFSVTQRTREIGVRMALGARPAAILRMIVGRSSVPTAIGIAIGAAGAAAAVSVTASALSEVDVRDPIAYLLVITPLVALVFLGTCIPARRATKVDPMLALRAE